MTEASHLIGVATEKTARAVKTAIPTTVGPLLKENTDVPLAKDVETATPYTTPSQAVPAKDDWVRLFKGSKQHSKNGEGFTVPSGEVWVMIPKSVIEKYQRAWESFIIGQVYADPPSQRTIHTIFN